uniref:Uncharacterized protein n=1 Tax=Acrobeloides nanus TaxID=290746 RepID=A0A914EBQ5_9BILA
MDATAGVFPPPPYSEGWPHAPPGMHHPSFRPEFPSTSNMMPFHPSMVPNEHMPNSDSGHPHMMGMPMMQPNGMFPPQFGPGPGGPGPMNFPNGMHRFPGPGNFPHQLSPGFPQHGINSPSLNDFGSIGAGQNQSSPFGGQDGDHGSNSTSNTPMKNQNGNLPFSPNATNGFVEPPKSQPSRFLFNSNMANEALQAVKNQQFDSMASWHLANHPSTSQASMNGMNGVMGKDANANSNRGTKRKASSQSIEQQQQHFNPDMGMPNPGSANPDFSNPGHPFSNENGVVNNDFLRPSSTKSDGITGNESDPLRCIQRMTEQVDEAPANKISRTSSETLNDKTKRTTQETTDKLRKLNEIESKLLKQPLLDGQQQRLPPFFGGPSFPQRMPFMPGGPMPPGMMGPQYDPQMMAAMQRAPYGPGMPSGPYPIGPNGMPMMPGGMMPGPGGPRGMLPPNAMPGNFPPNMFPGGPMHSPSFGTQMTPTSSAVHQMMPQPNMQFPPGSSPSPMGEPGMPPPYHMVTSAGMMQQSPRFPGPGNMGPGGMMPPGMMQMGGMRPGFPNEMGMIRGPCPPDGFNGWSPHQMPQPLTNLESRVPTAKVHYMPQK